MRYHYVITLQFEQRGGPQQVSYETGVYDPAPGQTRHEVYRDIFQKAARRGGGHNPVPLFFSLEPDVLETADQMAAEENRR